MTQTLSDYVKDFGKEAMKDSSSYQMKRYFLQHFDCVLAGHEVTFSNIGLWCSNDDIKPCELHEYSPTDWTNEFCVICGK